MGAKAGHRKSRLVWTSVNGFEFEFVLYTNLQIHRHRGKGYRPKSIFPVSEL